MTRAALLALLLLPGCPAYAQHAHATWTESAGATGYRIYVGDTPAAITPTPHGDGTLSGVAAAQPGDRIAVSAVGDGGESQRSNVIQLALATTPTPALGTPTARPTPIGRIGAKYPTDLAVLYLSCQLDHPGTGFCRDHTLTPDWQNVELYLKQQAVFKGFTVQIPAGPVPGKIGFWIATKGNPRLLGCEVQVGTDHCESKPVLVGGDSLSLWMDASQLPADANYSATAMAKVSLVDPVTGLPFDSVMGFGGVHDGDAQWLLDGSCFAQMGWVNGGGMYGNDTNPQNCLLPVNTNGGLLTGLTFSSGATAIEPGVVESVTVSNITSGRDIFAATLNAGESLKVVNGCTGKDCAPYGPGDHERIGDGKLDYLYIRYNCTKNGAKCTADNQPLAGHFRNIGLFSTGWKGTWYVTASYGWPRGSLPSQNPDYAGWMAQNIGYCSAGANCAFLLPTTGAELITDFMAGATARFGHETRVEICAGPANTWYDLPCVDGFGCRINTLGRPCRSSGVLWMGPGWYWTIFAYPEMYPVGHTWGPGVVWAAAIIHAVPVAP